MLPHAQRANELVQVLSLPPPHARANEFVEVPSLTELERQVRDVHKIPPGNLVMTFKNRCGKEVTILSDCDVEEAIIENEGGSGRAYIMAKLVGDGGAQQQHTAVAHADDPIMAQVQSYLRQWVTVMNNALDSYARSRRARRDAEMMSSLPSRCNPPRQAQQAALPSRQDPPSNSNPEMRFILLNCAQVVH